MKRNLGKFDRLVRMTIAAFLILVVLSNYVLGAWAVVSVIVALVLFGTAIFGYCPIYSILKISSLKK